MSSRVRPPLGGVSFFGALAPLLTSGILCPPLGGVRFVGTLAPLLTSSILWTAGGGNAGSPLGGDLS